MTAEADFYPAVEAWIADDPDAGDRAELAALLDRAFRDAGAADELRDRFAGRLAFGTAGLRGVMGGGPNRMNRAVVRAATAAVAGWLRGSGSVALGCDARHRSAEFADEAARVLAGAGIAVHMLPVPCPTPLLAFAVRHLAAAAGIMITASHNPAADNGYKLYLSDGAQVIPPVDAEIEKRMTDLGPLAEVPVADAASPLITRHGDEVAVAYLDAVAFSAREWPLLNVVYTPMHGVAGDLMLRAIRRAGFADPHVVAAQARPDPDFPTVAFPNPEEPGALDLALADARRLGADLVLASDPDGDRLAVAVPRPGWGWPDGGWQVLTGDQLGALLGASVLALTGGSSRSLVASTIVSSTLLAKVAAAAGADYAETLTGFKWIVRAADGRPGVRFVFGYEEALGYVVGDVVRDKDGIGAALAMLRLAAAAKAAGRSVLDEYDDLETAHGVHLTSQITVRTTDQARLMSRLRASPPTTLSGGEVTGIADLGQPDEASGLPSADVLIFRLAGARVVLRPSGTEPKVKCYIEVVEPLAGRSLAAAREAAAGRMAPLRSALQALLAFLGNHGGGGGHRGRRQRRPDREIFPGALGAVTVIRAAGGVRCAHADGRVDGLRGVCQGHRRLARLLPGARLQRGLDGPGRNLGLDRPAEQRVPRPARLDHAAAGPATTAAAVLRLLRRPRGRRPRLGGGRGAGDQDRASAARARRRGQGDGPGRPYPAARAAGTLRVPGAGRRR